MRDHDVACSLNVSTNHSLTNHSTNQSSHRFIPHLEYESGVFQNSPLNHFLVIGQAFMQQLVEVGQEVLVIGLATPRAEYADQCAVCRHALLNVTCGTQVAGTRRERRTEKRGRWRGREQKEGGERRQDGRDAVRKVYDEEQRDDSTLRPRQLTTVC